MDWDGWRNEFPILKRKTYLNSCSLGPLSLRVKNALREYVDAWDMENTENSWNAWLEAVNQAKMSFAKLINANPEEIAVTYSASTAICSVASALDFGMKDEVVVTELDFPTNNYIWLANSKLGAKVKILSSKDNVSIPLEEYENAVTERTLILSTSHVFSFSGFMQRLDAISEICRERDAIFLVDAYQSAGTVPIDVKKVEVDVLISGSVKWLLGGPGIAFMYVRKDLIERFEPSCIGWFASENPFDFDSTRFTYAPDARRFQHGTPSVASAYSAKAGIDIILEANPRKIRKRTVELTQRIVEEAKERGISIRTPENPEDRGAIVVLEMPNSMEIFDRLTAEGVVTSYRNGIRVSPHFFNNEEDVERLFRLMS
jgi:selenocysteine lyase/cysteine desulfurase